MIYKKNNAQLFKDLLVKSEQMLNVNTVLLFIRMENTLVITIFSIGHASLQKFFKLDSNLSMGPS
jgi:hypothetical protein